jgi:hypothetical protein
LLSLSQGFGPPLPVFRNETATAKEASLAFAGPMLRVEQLQHDLGLRHFGCVNGW